MRTLTWNLLALGALAFASTTGCVVYEGEFSGGCDWDEDCFDDGFACGDEDEDGIADCEDEGQDEAIPVELSMSPSHAERGETFPAVITLDQGDFDLTLVQEIQFFGDVEVLSATAGNDQIILVLQVAEDAELGAIDVALDAGDSGHVLDGALTVFEAGSGNSALDWTDGSGECE